MVGHLQRVAESQFVVVQQRIYLPVESWQQYRGSDGILTERTRRHMVVCRRRLECLVSGRESGHMVVLKHFGGLWLSLVISVLPISYDRERLIAQSDGSRVFLRMIVCTPDESKDCHAQE